VDTLGDSATLLRHSTTKGLPTPDLPYILTTYLTKIHLNVIVIHISSFQTDVLQQVFLPKFITHPLSPILVTCPAHHNLLYITVLLTDTVGDLYKLGRSSYSSLSSSWVGSYTIVTVSALFPLNIIGYVLHPYKKNSHMESSRNYNFQYK
jgi:hypothetical protein